MFSHIYLPGIAQLAVEENEKARQDASTGENINILKVKMVAGYIQPGAWLSSGCPSRLPGLPESTPSIQVTDGREYNVQLSQISNQTQDGVSS